MPPAAPLSPLVGHAVLPGDCVLSLADVAAGGAAGATPAVRLGPSLLQSGGEVRAIRSGTLRQTGGGKLWLETSHKRYLPAAEDAVVGIVVERHAEVRRPPRRSRVSLVSGMFSSPPALRRAELRGRHRRPVQGCAACAGFRERHATQQARTAAAQLTAAPVG